jgi:hypothetical protein
MTAPSPSPSPGAITVRGNPSAEELAALLCVLLPGTAAPSIPQATPTSSAAPVAPGRAAAFAYMAAARRGPHDYRSPTGWRARTQIIRTTDRSEERI